jgi:hypothetical protein
MVGLIALLSLAACTTQPGRAGWVTGAPRTSAATGQLSWVRRTYYGAGLAVTLTQPATWTPRLAPRGFHYGATLAYLANFGLRPYCRPAPATMTCDPRRVGAYPDGGVVVTLSVWGFGPGPMPQSQLFAGGSPVLAGGRRAARRRFDVAGCLGLGADHAVDYTIDDGQAAGALGLVICWRGRSPVLAQEVKDIVQGMRIAADPRNRGPHPD